MPDLPRRPDHNAAQHCPHCQRPLPALRARLASVCEQPACRHQQDVVQQQALRAETDARLRHALAPVLGAQAARQVPLVWIQAHQTELTALPDTTRQQHLAHLQQQADLARTGQVVAADADAATSDPAPGHPDRPASSAQPARQLCGWCSGRCCRFGSDSGAYIDAAVLLRWVRQHPGTTLDDAVSAYASSQAALHVRDSCVYHGAQGCVLPRDMRAGTCNAYACDGLRLVLGKGPLPAPHHDQQTWVFLMADKAGPRQVQLATPQGLTPLSLPEITT